MVRARYYKVLYLFLKNKTFYKVLYFIEGLIFFDRSYIFLISLILDVPYQFVKAYIFKDTSVKRYTLRFVYDDSLSLWDVLLYSTGVVTSVSVHSTHISF